MVYGKCKDCGLTKQIYSNGYCRPCYKYNMNFCVDEDIYPVKGKVRPSIMHVYIYHKLKENCEFNGNMLSRELVKIMFLRSHIPNIIQSDFLCEMEELGMVKLKDKRNIEVVV
jgi:hypothetical protein